MADIYKYVSAPVNILYKYYNKGRKAIWVDLPSSYFNHIPSFSIFDIPGHPLLVLLQSEGNLLQFREFENSTKTTEIEHSVLPSKLRVLIHEEVGVSSNAKNPSSIPDQMTTIAGSVCLSTLVNLAYFFYSPVFNIKISLLPHLIISSIGLATLQIYLLRDGDLASKLCGKSKNGCDTLLETNPFKHSAFHPYVIGSVFFSGQIFLAELQYGETIMILLVIALITLPFVALFHIRVAKLCKVCAGATLLMIGTMISAYNADLNNQLNLMRGLMGLGTLIPAWLLFLIFYQTKQMEKIRYESIARLKFFQVDSSVFRTIHGGSTKIEDTLTSPSAIILGPSNALNKITLILHLQCEHCGVIFDEYMNIFLLAESLNIRVLFANQILNKIERSFVFEMYEGPESSIQKIQHVKNWYRGTFTAKRLYSKLDPSTYLIKEHSYFPKIIVNGVELPKVYDKTDILYHLNNSLSHR